jgi:hypothetical protein
VIPTVFASFETIGMNLSVTKAPINDTERTIERENGLKLWTRENKFGRKKKTKRKPKKSGIMKHKMDVNGERMKCNLKQFLRNETGEKEKEKERGLDLSFVSDFPPVFLFGSSGSHVDPRREDGDHSIHRASDI